MKLTVDANIWVGALDVNDPACETCRACLVKAAEKSARLYSPVLLPVEVAATIGRKTRNTRQGQLAAAWVRNFVGHVWQPLTEESAADAERVAATLFLRGADAIYVAVARLSDAVLLTYDAEVIARAAKTVCVMTPDDWLSVVGRQQGMKR
jgi:predicted nucleic acid-binding protein